MFSNEYILGFINCSFCNIQQEERFFCSCVLLLLLFIITNLRDKTRWIVGINNGTIECNNVHVELNLELILELRFDGDDLDEGGDNCGGDTGDL